MVNIEIYNDARPLAPPGKGVINWDSGVGICGILLINGVVCEYLALEIIDSAPQ